MFRNSSEGGHEIAVITEFVIVGFPDPPEMKLFFFAVFLLLYLLTITANFTIVALICVDKRLHTPMYFFLGSYSFIETVYVSTTVPKLLDMFLSGNHTISFNACMTQLCLFSTCGGWEALLLLVMSYDRYLAICCPLHYHTIMTLKRCIYLVLGSFLLISLCLVFPLFLMTTLPFCGSNRLDHFFCESAPMFKLACRDTSFIKATFSIAASVITFVSFLFIMVSYTSVMIAISRMPSTTGKQKAFSTCATHITVVFMFFLTICVMYVKPSDKPIQNKVVAVVYGVLIPCLNPFIYSLRNKDIKTALMSVLSRTKRWPTRDGTIKVVFHDQKE